MPVSFRASCIASLVLIASPLAALPAEERVVPRQVPLGGGRGSVSVEVPAEWQFEAFPHDSPPSATVRLGPASDQFDFRLGLVWLDPGMRVALETVKERVRIAANDALLKSVERNAELLEIRGKETAGYYYSLKDKFPSKRPGEYPYMTQGIAVTGPVTTVFTLFSRTADPAERERALRTIASSRWSDAPAEAPPPSPAPTVVAPPPAAAPRSPPARPQDLLSVRTDESTDSWRLTVPISHAVLTIRKGGWKKGKAPQNPSPGYFLLQDKEHGTIASGWFDSSEHFEGLEKFWEHESSSLKRQSLPAPEDVKFTKVGGWDAIVYHQAVPGGTSAHVRAEWVVEGTWVDLHLSTTGKGPPAEARSILLQQLEAFRVEDKD